MQLYDVEYFLQGTSSSSSNSLVQCSAIKEEPPDSASASHGGPLRNDVMISLGTSSSYFVPAPSRYEVPSGVSGGVQGSASSGHSSVIQSTAAVVNGSAGTSSSSGKSRAFRCVWLGGRYLLCI